MELNRREILRYLGYKSGNEPDERTRELMEEVILEIMEVAEPKCVYRIFPVKSLKENLVDLGFVQLHSRQLAGNLKSCHQVVFLAVTLGSSVELLLQRYNRLQVSRAVMLQAVAAEWIEQYCDACEEAILSELGEGCFLRPRFSPGYGDFSLEFQRTLLQVLEAPKRIGLTLTDSLMMMPSKSVTAVIGISREDTTCHKKGCEICEKMNCEYRRG